MRHKADKTSLVPAQHTYKTCNSEREPRARSLRGWFNSKKTRRPRYSRRMYVLANVNNVQGTNGIAAGTRWYSESDVESFRRNPAKGTKKYIPTTSAVYAQNDVY